MSFTLLGLQLGNEGNRWLNSDYDDDRVYVHNSSRTGLVPDDPGDTIWDFGTYTGSYSVAATVIDYSETDHVAVISASGDTGGGCLTVTTSVADAS